MPTIQCPKTGKFLLQLGMYISDKGYWRYSGGEHRGKYVHRHLMEIAIGRPLRKDEVVHHGNGCKLDIRIENLIVITERQHNAVSAKQYWYLKTYVWGKEEQAWRDYFQNSPEGEHSLPA